MSTREMAARLFTTRMISDLEIQILSPNPSGPPAFTSRVDRALGPACHQPDHYVVSPQVRYSIVKYPCAFGAVASRLHRSSRFCRATTKIIRGSASVCPPRLTVPQWRRCRHPPAPRTGAHNAPSYLDGNAAGKYSPSIKKTLWGTPPAASDARPFTYMRKLERKLH
jgi:hypothetical protein